MLNIPSIHMLNLLVLFCCLWQQLQRGEHSLYRNATATEYKETEQNKCSYTLTQTHTHTKTHNLFFTDLSHFHIWADPSK